MIQRHPLLNLALEPIARDSCVGAMVPKAGSGRVLHQENVDEPAYPASLIKPMYLLIHPQAVAGAKIGLAAPEIISVEAEYKGKRVIVAILDSQFKQAPNRSALKFMELALVQSLSLTVE